MNYTGRIYIQKKDADPVAGRAVAPAQDSWSEERNAEQPATGIVDRGRTPARRDEVEAEARREPLTRTPREPQAASGPQTAAGETAARRRSHSLCERTATLRRGDGGDRLRRKRAARCGAGAVICARDQAREASVPENVAASQMAPLAPRIVEKGLASDRGGDQHGGREVLRSPAAVPARSDAGARGGRGDRARDAGWVGDACGRTAGGHWMGAMRRDLLAASYLQADETPVPVQMHDGAERITAYLWQYGKPGGETVFDFRLGRGREGPASFSGEWEGILQTDGYAAYDDIGGPKLVHVGCWAHARRKFVDAVKVNPQDAAAVAMVTRMDALFLIDRDARRRS